MPKSKGFFSSDLFIGGELIGMIVLTCIWAFQKFWQVDLSSPRYEESWRPLVITVIPKIKDNILKKNLHFSILYYQPIYFILKSQKNIYEIKQVKTNMLS